MAPAFVVVAIAWLRFEQPLAPLWRVFALVALALAAATPQRRSLRLLGGVVATLIAARIVFGVDLLPWRAASGFSTLGTQFSRGFSDFYDTHLPFDPAIHVAMAELVLAAIFGFSLVAAMLAAERKAVAAACAVVLGAGWPATLLGPSDAVLMGAVILVAALVVLAGLGSRRVPALAVPAVAIVAAGALAVGSATASRHPLVHWQSWNLAHAGAGPVGVGFVWNARYDGLKWPSHPTVVLDVQSHKRPTYLRAAVLDDFVGDRWKVGLPRPADFLEPAAALRPANQTRELVTVEGLANRELVGGSVPVRYLVGGSELKQDVRGLVSLDEGVPPGFQYTVWSYSPRVTAAELRRSPPDYPAALIRGDMFDVGRDVPMPAFGARGRAASVQGRLATSPDLYPYRPLARLADEVAGRARTPYDAVARLEQWFLVSGGFTYSNHPPVISPPLVSFVMQTRAGYCQYFAGAMTLMLRYLGIPARVAVGFAGGTYSAKRHAWLVTDLDSHAWVEVWFKGYGWLPFDPTPPVPGSTRVPALPGSSFPFVSSGPPSVPTFHGTADFAGKSAVASKLRRQNGLVGPHTGVGRLAVGEDRGRGVGNRAWPVLLLLLALGATAGGIVVVKAGFRLSRRAVRDPRRVAAACREELALFLVDQRIDVPPSATLRELGELVRFEFGADPASFVAAASAARFAPRDAASPAARAARRELSALLDDTRRGLTRWERIRGLFSVRSLARRATAVDASASLESVSVGS
ncbi:MAG TPA: transglutaminaseTgpA domain-containing protein [Gaiellaceae bacterium]|nr:transglutaminaseTgpA domain-containing protein [Gaiellaceae bacterium]